MAILQTLKHQFFDSSGNPLSGGKLYAYVAGTSTPKDTYTDQGGLTANANPVILDSRGEASIWFNGSYKVVLKTAADATIWTVDNIQAPTAGFVTLTGIETLERKTLISPSMSSPTITGAGVVTGSLTTSGAGTIGGTVAATTGTFSGAVTGAAAITSSSPTAGIGYATGAGGTVTQITSITAGVTLNKICGEIITVSAAFTAGTPVVFNFQNIEITAHDTFNFSSTINSGTDPNALFSAKNVIANACNIMIYPTVTSTASLKIKFTIYRNVIA